MLMPNNSKEQGFSHLLAVLTIGVFTFLLISSAIPITRQYNDGRSNIAGVYLAKEGGSSEDKDSSGGSNSGSSGSSSGVEVKTTPEKIKTEIIQGDLRMKFEIENGQVKIETKVKSANEVERQLENEAENEAVEEMEAELEKADIKVATAPGQIALVNKNVGALSNFPLSVNPATKQLTVTTPAGSKIVAVLPQKAIDNMLAAHIMDDVISEKVNNSLASVPELVRLEVKNGTLVYQVKGTRTHKLLGLILVKTGVEAFISAENGQVVETSQSLLGRILNRVAP